MQIKARLLSRYATIKNFKSQTTLFYSWHDHDDDEGQHADCLSRSPIIVS